MLERNVIHVVTQVTPDLVRVASPMFSVPKGPDDIRPIFNLTWLNQFVEAEHFQMEDMRTALGLLRPGDWFTKVDIKDAYMHVAMHPSAFPYLCFFWEKTCYRYNTMPFGANMAPRAFTKIMRPIVAIRRSKGSRLVVYLDDILIMSESPEASREETHALLDLLTRLGFLINWPKSSLVPAQTIEFLGFRLDSGAMTIALPKNKVASLRHLVGEALQDPIMPIRRLASVVGSLNASAMAVMPTRLRTRALLRDKIDALQDSHQQWDRLVQLSPEAQDELVWWRDNLDQWNGRSVIPSEPDLAMYTDASNTGWGAVLAGQVAKGFWTPEERALHINELEMMAIELGLRSFLPQVRGKVLLLRVDNTTAVAYVNHQGGTRSPRLSAAARRIWELALDNGMYLEAVHIPGVDNVEADAASRAGPSPHEWRLNPSIFQDLERMTGRFSVDLFATRMNAQLPRFFSWHWDPAAAALDALQQPWGSERAYANPPWALIPDVLAKIRRDRAQVVLIAPIWPTQAWYPAVLELLAASPILLPRDADLFCPDHSLVRVGPPSWEAAAWPLSGNASETSAFLRGLPLWQPTVGPSAHDAITIPTGAGGSAGVLRGRSIPFVALRR